MIHNKIKAKKQQIQVLSKALSVSVMNQVVSSGSNFVLGLYLVRSLSPDEFGIYGICFAICLLYNGFGNALLLTQMVVHLPDKKLDEKLLYAARILVMTALLGSLTILISNSVFVVIAKVWPHLPGLAHVGNALLFAAVLACQYFFLRHAYCTHREIRALATSFSWSCALIVLLLMARLLELKLNAVVALWVFSLSNFFAVFVAYFINKLPVKKTQWNLIRSDCLEAFEHGRWAVGGVTVTWLQSQAYMYITALFLGPVGVASANAGRMLISPFSFILPAFNQLILPRLSEARNTDKQKMLRIGLLYTITILVMAVVYVTILLLKLQYFVSIVVGDKYQLNDLTPLVIAWCLVLLFQLARSGLSLILQALKAFKGLMFDNLFSAIIAVVATFLLMFQLQIQGAILGTGLGEMILALFLWKRLKNEYRKNSY